MTNTSYALSHLSYLCYILCALVIYAVCSEIVIIMGILFIVSCFGFQEECLYLWFMNFVFDLIYPLIYFLWIFLLNQEGFVFFFKCLFSIITTEIGRNFRSNNYSWQAYLTWWKCNSSGLQALTSCVHWWNIYIWCNSVCPSPWSRLVANPLKPLSLPFLAFVVLTNSQSVSVFYPGPGRPIYPTSSARDSAHITIMFPGETCWPSTQSCLPCPSLWG